MLARQVVSGWGRLVYASAGAPGSTGQGPVGPSRVDPLFKYPFKTPIFLSFFLYNILGVRARRGGGCLGVFE